jgi:mRNA deadenylase 3'-5' endonuclease subunit Ccr4
MCQPSYRAMELAAPLPASMSGGWFSTVSVLIRPEDDMKRNAGESQSLIRFLPKRHNPLHMLCRPHAGAAPGSPGEPAYTTYHHGSHACVDYIWAGEGCHVAAVCEMLPRQALEQHGGLPNEAWPSDHMALLADIVVPYTRDADADHDIV